MGDEKNALVINVKMRRMKSAEDGEDLARPRLKKNTRHRSSHSLG